jgi:NAD(P)-dependent dehydrogenase (short-subunit alcohol dehydrogenase family)
LGAQVAANDAARSHTGSAASARLCEGESSLKGKVVLVTGGGRGLGRLLASSLARAGAAVGLIARSATELDTAVGEIRQSGGIAVAAQADLASGREAAAAITHVRERLGRLDVVINNAGICGPVGPMWEVDATDWWKTFEINIGGSFLAARLALPGMIEARQGIIINIASYAGIYRWPLVSAYSASKAALTKLSENLAAETRRYGIAVFSVDPGLLPIGLSTRALSSANETTTEGRFQRWIRDQIETGHGADPEQAARLVLALASGRANRLSGRHVTVRDSIDLLLTDIDRIEREDLRTLRLRTG